NPGEVNNNLPRFYSGGGISLPGERWDVDRSMEWYDKVIWIFKCVDTIASNQASLPIYLHKDGDPKNEHTDDKEVVQMLNYNPNKHENAWDFRYRLSSQLLLSPKGAFIEIQRNKLDQIVAIYLLDPGSVEPQKDYKNFVSHYAVLTQANDGFGRPGQYKRRVEPRNMLWLRSRPHPTDPYRNVTPLVSAGIAAETDYFARVYNRNFLKNDGRPGTLILITGDMDDESADEIKNVFSGGGSNAGTTAVVEAENGSIIDLANNRRDSQWDMAIKG